MERLPSPKVGRGFQHNGCAFFNFKLRTTLSLVLSVADGRAIRLSSRIEAPTVSQCNKESSLAADHAGPFQHLFTDPEQGIIVEVCETCSGSVVRLTDKSSEAERTARESD
jgi:hypothetical protein